MIGTKVNLSNLIGQPSKTSTSTVCGPRSNPRDHERSTNAYDHGAAAFGAISPPLGLGSQVREG